MFSTRINATWFGVTLILLLLLFSGAYIYITHVQNGLDLARKQSAAEAEFFSGLIEERLQKKEYQFAREIVESWGENATEIVEILLKTKNGFDLAHYRTDEPVTHEIVNNVEIPYAYNGWATLTLHSSVDGIYEAQRVLLLQFLVGYVFIAAVLVYLGLANQSIQRQKLALSYENQKRVIAESELLQHRDHLEDMVEERTVELEHMRDEALSAAQAKSEFLATVSHELRTPLNAILGFTGIVRDGDAGDINEEQKKQLSMAHESGQHLLELINDILDLSKIEAGKQELFSENFSFPLLVKELTDMLQPLVDKKGLSLVVDMQTVPELICTDRGKLKQVLLNLLGNAVKFTDSGTISLRGETIGDALTISITDTGIGIDVADQSRIFWAFSQIDRGDDRLHEGTGLGLVISKKFVLMMGGHLGVKSEPGVGSTFTISLPLKTIEWDAKRGDDCQ